MRWIELVGKKYQIIGVTVHSHCVESYEGLLQRYRRGRGCVGLNCEKTQFFLNSLYIQGGREGRLCLCNFFTYIFLHHSLTLKIQGVQ